MHLFRLDTHGDVNTVKLTRYNGKLCSVEGCADTCYCRSMCVLHYGRWKSNGNPLIVHKPYPWEERFISRMFSSAKFRASKVGCSFSIQPQDIQVPKFCPMLGIELWPSVGVKSDNSPSLDRINPTLGYVPGNIMVISELANRIKSNATPDQVMKVALFMEKESLKRAA